MAKAREAMSEMLGRLKQSHLDIIPAEAFAQIESGPGSREGSPGLDVRLIDGQVLVSSVAEGSPAAAAGIRPGWEIVAIDGRDLGPALGLIRKDFEKEVFQTNQGTLQVTISMGIATYPNHARKKEELIDLADTALYAAKIGGRNQVRTWKKGMQKKSSG